MLCNSLHCGHYVTMCSVWCCLMILLLLGLIVILTDVYAMYCVENKVLLYITTVYNKLCIMVYIEGHSHY